MAGKFSEELVALQKGGIELRGEFLWGSNYTFLVNVNYKGKNIHAVYKPTEGVRPLWDFPQESLPRREVATFVVSQALGWELVPPTIFRRDAPFGSGSLQLFIEHDPEYHYFNFSDEHIQRLRPTVLFDVLINNADRKGSHLLIDPDDHLWLIDHGVCFHVRYKLRTVIWDFVGEEIPDSLYQDLLLLWEQFNQDSSELVKELRSYINDAEIEATFDRLQGLLQAARFPDPVPERRNIPWPEI